MRLIFAGNAGAREPRVEFARSSGIFYNVSLMYAIIETGGKQYWVIPGETVQVGKLSAKAGETLELKALWAAEEDEKRGKSSQKATVTVEVVRQLKGKKVIVFKKKPKSHYRRKQGHRQALTEIRIKKISLN